MCVYMYMYVCLYMYIYIYIYTHAYTHIFERVYHSPAARPLLASRWSSAPVCRDESSSSAPVRELIDTQLYIYIYIYSIYV